MTSLLRLRHTRLTARRGDLLWAAALLALCVTALEAQRRGGPLPKQADAKASVAIPLQQLDYLPPASNLLLLRVAGTTLNFVDSNHLLFTFHGHGLLKRAADAEPDDDDQLIHAEVINIATRQIEVAADWRMHDRSRYLWPVGRGRFLVRQRNALFQTDASLRLEPFVQFPGMLRSVQVSPDGRSLVTETEEVALRSSASKRSNTEAIGTLADGDAAEASALPIKVQIISLEDKRVMAQTRTRTIPMVPAGGLGFLQEVHAGGNRWAVTYKSFDGHERKLVEIGSSCTPALQFLSASVALIVSCDPLMKIHLLTAVNVDGKTLWDRTLDSKRIWPAYAYAEDGSRFALATLVLNHAVSATDPFEKEDVSGQVAEVFDTAGGEARLVAPAAPVLDSGQNFALSPDGHRFAIVHNDAIEIYDLK